MRRIRVEHITSNQNPSVKLARSLKDRKSRVAEGKFLVEGAVMIREAVQCGLAMHMLFARESEAAFAEEMRGHCRDCYIVPDRILTQVCDTQTPQGVCAVFSLPQMTDIDHLPNRIVALDGVQDPGNVGTIWRTADAAGFGAVIFGKGTADGYSPKVQRSAMGSGFRLKQMVTDDLADTLAQLRSRGYRVIASLLDGEPFFEREDVGGKYVLIVGNEAKGISQSVREQADVRLKLPMYGGAESLNAAVAAAIMMYDLVRFDHGK